MAASTLHFSLGIAVATAAALPRLARRWHAGGAVSGPLRRWLMASYGLGLWATAPAWLPSLGIPGAWCVQWWANVFLFHPLLTGLKQGGRLYGACAMAILLAAQYLVLLLAVRRAHRRAS